MSEDPRIQRRIVFQQVIQAGGLEAARRHLGGLDPSGIRRHLYALEEEFGTTLYERHTFALTPAGRALFDYDRPLLEKLLQAKAHLDRKLSPRLTAGLAHSAAKRFLLGPVRTWLEDPACPPIDCRFGSLAQLRPLLESGELDLLITASAGDEPAGFASRVLAKFPLVLIVPANDLLLSDQSLWDQRRISLPLIAPEADDPVRLVFARGLRRGGHTWPARLICDSPASMVELVVAGLGYGLSLAAEPVPPSATIVPARTSRRPAGKAAARLAASQPAAKGAHPLDRTHARGIREVPLRGFDPVEIVALWRPEDSLRLQKPLALLNRSS
jgi:DNA-binding transcriptional LysR family regulator